MIVEDGGDFDLSETEKEIKISAVRTGKKTNAYHPLPPGAARSLPAVCSVYPLFLSLVGSNGG